MSQKYNDWLPQSRIVRQNKWEWTDLQEKAKKEEMEFNLIGNKYTELPCSKFS